MARRNRYKSGFELTVSKSLTQKKLKFTYETIKVPFTQPEIERVYTPDFIVKRAKTSKSADLCVIEAKGKLDLEGRKKLLWVKEQHPKLDLKLLFMDASKKIRKRSKVSYGDWATKNGFDWACFKSEGIPNKWFK